MDKLALRTHYRSLRRKITDANAKLWSEGMAHDLRLRLRKAKFDGALFGYLAAQGEPDLLSFMRHDRYQIAVPKVLGKGRMDFFLWSPGDPVMMGPFGIFEPVDLTRPVAPRRGDAALIPALAIDHFGHRLGHGGGYYDRWLHEHRECLIFAAGSVFPPFISEVSLPAQSFDERVDFILATSPSVDNFDNATSDPAKKLLNFK